MRHLFLLLTLSLGCGSTPKARENLCNMNYAKAEHIMNSVQIQYMDNVFEIYNLEKRTLEENDTIIFKNIGKIEKNPNTNCPDFNILNFTVTITRKNGNLIYSPVINLYRESLEVIQLLPPNTVQKIQNKNFPLADLGVFELQIRP